MSPDSCPVVPASTPREWSACWEETGSSVAAATAHQNPGSLAQVPEWEWAGGRSCEYVAVLEQGQVQQGQVQQGQVQGQGGQVQVSLMQQAAWAELHTHPPLHPL